MGKEYEGGKEKWIPGTVVKINGPSTYIVRMAGNVRRFVHADHLRCDDSLEFAIPKVTFPVDTTSLVDKAQSAAPGPIPEICPLPRLSSDSSLRVPCLGAESSPVPVSSSSSPARVPPLIKNSGAISEETLNSPARVSRTGRLIKPPQRRPLIVLLL